MRERKAIYEEATHHDRAILSFHSPRGSIELGRGIASRDCERVANSIMSFVDRYAADA